MSTIQKFKCVRFTAIGDEVFQIDSETTVSNLQITCISGKITIAGSAGDILGKPVSDIPLNAGQSFNFTSSQYERLTVTVFNGSEAIFVSN